MYITYIYYKGEHQHALYDMNQAVSLDPSNTYYRTNRALLLRNQGKYLYVYSCIHI